jgi:hypothetical protein
VIEAVEGLHPNLQAKPFCEIKRLGKGDVPIVDSRATQNVAAGIAKCAGKGLRKARGIEPLRWALLKSAIWIAAGNYVGTRVKRRHQEEWIVC